jgi:protein-L-isoaspartate O-methyltransferase
MKQPKQTLFRLALLSVLVALQAPASTLLTPATTLADCAVDTSRLLSPNSCALNLAGSASASLTTAPFVSLTAQAASPPNGGVIHGAAAKAVLTYSFEVIGGNPGDIVPVLIATSLSALGSDPSHGIGFAELSVHTGAAGDSFVAVCSDGTCGTTASSFSGTLRTRARSGDPNNELTLQVQASTGDSLLATSASASADPFIFVDPSFPEAALYSIVVSPGIGNAEITAVPEPGTMSLVLGAGALLGLARRRNIARLGGVFALCVFSSLSLHAQARDEVEKAIASLPLPPRAHERFRVWIDSRPPDQQREPESAERYVGSVKGRGFVDSDAADQVKVAEAQGARSEIERWNRILTSKEPAFNTRPNAFLMEIVKTRKSGTALDVGMGQGRNSIWLAQRGWTVTGFDPAERAVTLARETAASLGLALTTEIRRMEDFDFGERRWDLILLSYVGGREMPEVLQRALKPGGVLVIEGFHRDATRDLTIGSARVFDTGELPALYRQLRVVRYEEPVTDADFGPAIVRLVRYCGERPE